MVRALLANDCPRPILTMCYTNHALDAFLTDLLDAGVEKVGRVGSRSKSVRIQQLNLNQARLTRRQQQSISACFSQVKRLQSDIEARQSRLQRSADEMRNSLTDALREAMEDSVEHWADSGCFDSDKEWKQWCAGKRSRRGSNDRQSPLAWPRRKRERALAEWTARAQRVNQDELAARLRLLRDAYSELEQARAVETAERMRQCDVVGFTANGMAQHQAALKHLGSKVRIGCAQCSMCQEIDRIPGIPCGHRSLLWKRQPSCWKATCSAPSRLTRSSSFSSETTNRCVLVVATRRRVHSCEHCETA